MTTNTHFTSKEHYRAFRTAWSNAVNSKKAKSHCEEQTYHYHNSHNTYAVRVSGWISGAHHVLCNLLRNRDYHRGFTMVTNRNKLLNGTSPNLGLVQAVSKLKRVQKWIREEAAYQPQKKSFFGKFKAVREYSWTGDIDKFLAPFEGTVTREMIMDIELPECKQLYVYFGPGMKVIPMLMSGKAKANTQTDLDTLIKEVV